MVDPAPTSTVTKQADLETAGAIGTTYTPTVSPSLSAAKGQAVTTAISTIASTAVTAAQTGGSSEGTKDAVSALAQGLTTLAEAAAAQGGPAAQIAADVLSPSIAMTLADGIIAIANKIGVTVHDDLLKLSSWFTKL